MRFGKLVTPSRRRSRCKLCSNWARLVVIGLGALASAAGDTLVLPGGNIAVNSSCGTTFGSCSSASSSGNDLTFEQLNWFENKFGVLGRVSSNLTQGANFENAGASANYLTDLMIPPQQNLKAGDLVTFQLPYYIDGTVAIDWGDNFAVDADGNLIDLTKTAVDFTLASEILNLQTGQPDVQHLEDRHYSGNNHLTDVISDNVLVSGVVTIGVQPLPLFKRERKLYRDADQRLCGRRLPPHRGLGAGNRAGQFGKSDLEPPRPLGERLRFRQSARCRHCSRAIQYWDGADGRVGGVYSTAEVRTEDLRERFEAEPIPRPRAIVVH